MDPDKLVLEFFNKVWHQPHQLDAIDDLMHSDYKITTAGQVIRGRDNFKQWVRQFQQLLLEAKTENIDVFYNQAKTKVVSRWVCSGYNNGLFDLYPSKEHITFTGIAIWSVADGKLSECWVERSAYELFQTLKKNNDKRFV